MPAERAPMRKVREVLRLKHALGVSITKIPLITHCVFGRHRPLRLAGDVTVRTFDDAAEFARNERSLSLRHAQRLP